MSCSVFKEFPESNDNHVVVVINKNGNVSVDQSDLHDFLVNDSSKSNTTVSVVRLRSPTSSIEEELNEQEELEKEMARGLKCSYDESEEDGEKEKIARIPNVSVVVEKYYNAEEAKQLASEILGAAGITNPRQVAMDLDYQRLAVSNDHCYTPFTSPSQRKNEKRRNTPPTKKTEIAKIKSKPSPSKIQPKKAEVSDEEEELSDEEGDESESDNTYYSPSENENDRDSDLDFNVNDRPSRVRKFNRSKNSRNKRTKSVTKVMKKRASIGDDDKSDEPSVSSGKKKSVKRKTVSVNKAITPVTTPTPGVCSLKSTPVTSKGTQMVKSSTKLDLDFDLKKDSMPSSSSSIVTISGPPVPALAPITNSKIVQLQPKKEKKPPSHVDAYINMSSLFSTPDIIKKVGVESRSTPNTANVQTPMTQSKGFFMPLTPSSIKNSQQLPSQISVRTHTTTADLESEQDKQLELIDSFVQEELKQNTPPHIPSIVKMLENPESVMINDVINIGSNQSTTNIPFSNAGINSETLLDDSDILSGLGHAEDCLPEDLLQHVAKLVEDKKIQEVIDKQVLEENVTNATIPSVISTPTTVTSMSKANLNESVLIRGDATQIAKPLGNVIQSTTTPVAAKEPIKIVRSDGRVILPPLEAPTTRAKRRALMQTFDSAKKNEPVPVVITPKSSKSVPKIDEVKETTTRRSSTTKKTAEPKESKGKTPISTPPTTATVEPFDEDYDDEDSDGSYNAEDDPYRLWCICRQPHNNRFMICCDKCEDWFHGKFVNVTKAMGTEMEEQGIEWVCPNCIKKQPGKMSYFF